MPGIAWYVARVCILAVILAVGLVWRFRQPLTTGPIIAIGQGAAARANQLHGRTSRWAKQHHGHSQPSETSSTVQPAPRPFAAERDSTKGQCSEVPKATRPTSFGDPELLAYARAKRAPTNCPPGQKRNNAASCCVLYNCSGEHTHCADILFDILSYTADFLEQNNLEYYVTYGTLLGAVRDRDVIPWTGDIDLVVPMKSMLALLDADPETTPLLHGLRFSKELTGGIYPLIRGCHTAIHNSSHKPGNTMRYLDIYSSGWIEQYSKTINYSNMFRREHPQYVEIRGRKFPGPFPAEEFLDACYGPTWRTPAMKKDEHGGNTHARPAYKP
uniref:LicD/FKTN/FKRP nucleotidyltransferase domain-containing protein n=1 Tax=Zooxanthella nutricula TaxID=1333877 RepID=A0A7S2LVX7_9DINO